MVSLQNWRKRWQDAGVDVIPISPNSKQSKIKQWQTRDPQSQWQEAEPNGNIAVRLGGNFIRGIDCDAQETVKNVRLKLEGMGLKPPEIESISGCRHFYLRMENIPNNINNKKLNPELGKGDFRVKNSYLLAPYSSIDSNVYRFICGTPEQIANIPILQWPDFKWLVPLEKFETIPPRNPQISSNITPLPIRLVKREIPQNAKELFKQLKYAKKGHSVGKYPSRSEAEASIVTQCILHGWSCLEILDTFYKYCPGHFHESSNPSGYLFITYQNAVKEIKVAPIRKDIEKLFNLSHLVPWPGAGGITALATLQALLAVCWQWESLTIFAGVRDLALHAAAGIGGISNATKYLEKKGVLKIVERAKDGEANTYEILPEELIKVEHKSQVELGYSGGVGGEIWGWDGFGRSPGLMYALLSNVPISEENIVEITEKNIVTIQNALNRLSNVGLALQVSNGRGTNNKKWIKGSTNILDLANDSVFTESGNVRRNRFKSHRRAWRNWNKSNSIPNRGNM